LKSQKGFTLLEVLISVGILSLIGVTFLGALNTALMAVVVTDTRETAKNIAEMQLEVIKDQEFNTAGYTPRAITDDYPGFTIVTEDGKIYPQAITDRAGGAIQKIDITVQWNNRSIYTLTGYKIKP